MVIKATDEQVIEMGKLAILASQPMGMGFLHHDPGLAKDDIALVVEHGGLYIDYYMGRMVKFNARKSVDGKEWSFSDSIRSDYQSWIGTYPGYQALFDAAVK